MKNVNHTENVNANGVQESHLARKNDLKVQKNPLLRFSVSLALSLFIVYTIFQIQTPKEAELANDVTVIQDDAYYMPAFTAEVIKVKEPKPEPIVKPTLIIDKIKPVDDETKIKDQVLKTSEDPVEVSDKFDPNSVNVIDEPTDDPVDLEVPFAFVEDAPIFPGCEKYKSKKEQKKCMSEKIQKHVNKKFNTRIAEDVGLEEGVKRINVLFTIDENGNVIGIQSRAPHPKLQKEAERVVRLLPKMTPGKQRNQNVKVKYTLPIIFRVD
ncbi:energy transducer TonB [Kordia algicida OT-1]|uniref:TonB n=1 Tax=Kordia algicida OT-1 TaxID=391587 RepID=A9DPG8_9FLAO|nr:energy transducer TonB [Kordia algicida]EDP97432.1 TonB [Kordia algicida OT-1]